MKETEILQQLQTLMQDVFDEEDLEINKDSTAADVEDWDSLSNVNLIVAIEKAFGIKFNLRELQGLENVGALIQVILNHRS